MRERWRGGERQECEICFWSSKNASVISVNGLRGSNMKRMVPFRYFDLRGNCCGVWSKPMKQY